jgi:PAS domain S-box-containing protein
MRMVSPVARQWLLVITGFLVLTGGFAVLALHQYLLAHTLIELFGIAVAVAIFSIGWSTRKIARHSFFLVIAVVSLCTATMDCLHVLSYKGMNVFTLDVNIPTQFWIAARYLESLAYLAGAVMLARQRTVRAWPILISFSLLTTLLIASIVPLGIFPVALVAKVGLTPFKIYSEYVIAAFFCGAFAILWWQRVAMNPIVMRWLLVSLLLKTLAELMFTLYGTDVHGMYNALGHILRGDATIALYVALVYASLEMPYQTLFREVGESAQRYRMLAEATIEGIVMSNHQGIIDINPQFTKMSGYQPQELLGRSLLELVHPDDHDYVEHQKRVDAAYAYEFRLIRKDGAVVDVEALGSSATHHQGPLRITVLRDITQQKAADRQLHLLSSALESVANGVAITNADGQVLWVNPAFTRLTGYDRDEVIGGNPRILQSGLTDPRVYAEMWDTILCGAPWQGEIVNRRKDGTRYTEEMTITPVYAADGEIAYFVAVKQDVTARIAAQEALRASQAQYQQLFTEMSEGFAVHEIICDDQGTPVDYRFLEVNTAFERLTGLQAEAIVGHTVREVMPGIEPFWIDTYGHVALTGESMCFEQSAAPLARVYSVIAYRPQPGQFATIFIDITERTQMAAALLTRERLLDTVLQTLPVGLAILDREGEVVDVNARYCEIWGCQAAQSGLPPHQGWWADSKEELAPDEWAFRRALRGEVSINEMVHIQRLDGERATILQSAVPIIDGDGAVTGAVSVIQDFTAHHELQEQQRAILHMVSHDLRAPLTIINGHAGLLCEHAEEMNDPLTRQMAEIIVRGVKRMNIMIEDLVDAARVEGGQMVLQPKAVDLPVYLPELLNGNAAVLSKRDIQLNLAPDLPAAYIDDSRIDRVMLNLLMNAVNYSPASTPITIAATAQDDEIRLAITDQGSGIDPEDVPHLFNRFYRVHGAKYVKGAGLGLYITKLIVEAHGGRIWVDSVLGQGSTFYVTLPAVK